MKRVSLLLFLMMLIFMLVGTASAVQVGNAIIDRAVLDSATNIAFIDPTMVFTSDGTLDSWDFWLTGEDSDTFAAQIYRYTGTNADYELVHNDYYILGGAADGPGHGIAGSFAIQAGDVVGWWFGSAGGIIPFDWTNDATDQVLWKFGVSSPQVGVVYDFDYAYSGSITYREYSIRANYSPVPEPETMLLLGTGLIGLVGLGRKKFFKK